LLVPTHSDPVLSNLRLLFEWSGLTTFEAADTRWISVDRAKVPVQILKTKNLIRWRITLQQYEAVNSDSECRGPSGKARDAAKIMRIGKPHTAGDAEASDCHCARHQRPLKGPIAPKPVQTLFCFRHVARPMPSANQ
jgi:hypothetical protein